MSTTITIKLNAPASQFQAGESTGFGIRGGVRYYDRETNQNEWTNYEAVIFAKQAGQIQFYQQALVAGAVVEVMGKQEKIKTFDGQNGQKLSIELLDASLGMIHTGDQPQQQAPQQQGYAPQHQQPQGGYQQPQQQQYQQAPQKQPQGGFNPNQSPDGITF
jgi:single-strand DNA-binding protein